MLIIGWYLLHCTSPDQFKYIYLAHQCTDCSGVVTTDLRYTDSLMSGRHLFNIISRQNITLTLILMFCVQLSLIKIN